MKHSEIYRQRRAPYGFPFLDTEATKLLQDKTRESQSVLQSLGYERVMPPSLDYPDTFSDNERFDSFRTRDHLGDDLSLRSDVTVQVIKGYANLIERSESPVRRFFYTVPVFRDISRSYPALREVYQIGAEAIGLTAASAVGELLESARKIMQEIFQESPVFLTGDVNAYYEVEKFLGRDDLRDIVRNKNAPLLAQAFLSVGLDYGDAENLSRLLLFAPVTNEEYNSRWENLRPGLPLELARTLENIRSDLLSLLQNLPVAVRSISRIEPLLIRKTTYYTDFIFEGYIQGIKSPALRGGSYNHLVEEYSGQSMPASGFALDLSALSRI